MADKGDLSYLLAPKLTSRFAMDEIDASDIERVVNESYSVECVVGGEYHFRNSEPKVTANEVSSSILFLIEEAK